MTTKNRADRCVTHFHACDCREYRYECMIQALKTIYVLAATPISNRASEGFMWDALTAIGKRAKDILDDVK